MSPHDKKGPSTEIKAFFTRDAGETETVRAVIGPIRVISHVNHSMGLHSHDVIGSCAHEVSGNPVKPSFSHKGKHPESTEHLGNLYQ